MKGLLGQQRDVARVQVLPGAGGCLTEHSGGLKVQIVLQTCIIEFLRFHLDADLGRVALPGRRFGDGPGLIRRDDPGVVGSRIEVELKQKPGLYGNLVERAGSPVPGDHADLVCARA